MTRRLALAGIPSNSAGTASGVARAPAALRAAGLVAVLGKIDPTLLDLGDLPLPSPSPLRDDVSEPIDPDGLVAAIEAAAAATRAALAETALRCSHRGTGTGHGRHYDQHIRLVA